MKIDWMTLYNSKHVAAHCVTKIMTQLAKEVDPETVNILKVPGFAALDMKSLDVTLTVEGKEVSFVETVEWFATIHDEEVLRQAKELLEQKLGGMLNGVQDAFDSVEQGIRKKMREELSCSDPEDF